MAAVERKEGKPARPALWERGMASLAEAVTLLALCLWAAGRSGDLLFLLLHPIWCATWEAKIGSRPVHRLLGWRLESAGRLTLARSLARGVLRLLFPFLHFGWRRVTLFDVCTGCRWAVCPPSGKFSPPLSRPKPQGYR